MNAGNQKGLHSKGVLGFLSLVIEDRRIDTDREVSGCRWNYRQFVSVQDWPWFPSGNVRNVLGGRIRACRRQTEMRIKSSWREGFGLG
jgi:hypothetical protein